ncbi:ABC transporter permease [Legionella sp. W05-934-2]|jgi:putative ABC transport system permease protein|uniref:ABC transporter permease n=1 Tax=Legionella sp. W05-934-2 TaxID=1198649 RepID=UPI003463186B
MKMRQHLQQALLNIMAAKLRAFLALLGVLVGTAAVVALISCGQLATEKALAQFKKLGTDLLAIGVYSTTHGKGTHSTDISLDNWRKLPGSVPAIKRIAPYITTYQQMSYHGKTVQGAIIGADESLAETIHIRLNEGRFISFVHQYEHFAVVGQGLAKELKQIDGKEPIGQTIQVGQVIYTIIGVAKKWQQSGFFNEDVNRAIIVPIAGMSLLNKNAQVNNAVVTLLPNQSIEEITNQVRQYIHLIEPNKNIFLRSAQQIIDSMESQGRTFTLLLAVIGSISLLVGGIGVMNVMLVSVTERKKEIGIRKAIGAKQRDIQRLFLVESMTLSFLGGALGVMLGIVVTWIIAYFSRWPFFISLIPVLAGFIISVATGVFFGYYPAKRAAQLDPVVSLRSE